MNKYDGKSAVELLKTWARTFDEPFQSASFEFLDNPKLVEWSGAGRPGTHHYGNGGLARHTLEVVELTLRNATSMSGYYQQLSTTNSRIILFLSALFHDSGKLWDYKKDDILETILGGPVDAWTYSQHNKEIHHLIRSTIYWSEVATKHNIPEETKAAVLHCIASHHGRREWGSPVSPQTPEAWILHLSDSMSARVNEKCI